MSKNKTKLLSSSFFFVGFLGFPWTGCFLSLFLVVERYSMAISFVVFFSS